jgi:3-deoxy-D-manno-octulosonic-acid transferase
VVVGSTHQGEETLILDALQNFDFNIILAPRRLNRVESIQKILDERDFSWERLSDRNCSEAKEVSSQVLILDEFGRLEASYGRGDLAIIGGSWDDTGGHNLMEAAQFGLRVITGPNLKNFRSSASLLKDLNLLDVAEDEDELSSLVDRSLRELKEGSSKLSSRLRDEVVPIKNRYQEILRNHLSI